MKLTKEEKAELRASFRQMNLATKIDYIFTYYKVEIFVGLFFLLFFGSMGMKILTAKTPVAYFGLVNVVVGEDMEQAITQDYLTIAGENPRKVEITLYKGLYLSDDATVENHEYAYSSRLKVLANINAKSLDLVLMNKESYDIFSGNGYLMDLSDCPADLAPYLKSNEVVIEDNTIDQLLDESVEAIYKAETVSNAFVVNDSPVFKAAGFPEEVYLGIIGNSPRMDLSSGYVRYLMTGKVN